MKKLLCSLVFLLATAECCAQSIYNSSGRPKGYRHYSQQKGYDPSKLVYGGDFNFGYSGDYANFGVSPKLGYRFTEFLAAGVGIGYQYSKYPYGYDINSKLLFNRANLIYPGLWVKCKVFDPVFVAVDMEYALVSLKRDETYIDNYGNYAYRKTTYTGGAPCLLAGIGLRQEISERASMVMSIQYDVIQADFSPYYQNLVYRAGVLVGF